MGWKTKARRGNFTSTSRVLRFSPEGDTSPSPSPPQTHEEEGRKFDWEEILEPEMAFSFPQSTPSPFQQQQQQQQPSFQFEQPQSQFQVQLPQQPTFLFKADKSPATYNTKWEELHPDSQKYLLEIEWVFFSFSSYFVYSLIFIECLV